MWPDLPKVLLIFYNITNDSRIYTKKETFDFTCFHVSYPPILIYSHEMLIYPHFRNKLFTNFHRLFWPTRGSHSINYPFTYKKKRDKIVLKKVLFRHALKTDERSRQDVQKECFFEAYSRYARRTVSDPEAGFSADFTLYRYHTYRR